MYTCVCVTERKRQTDRDRQTDRETQRQGVGGEVGRIKWYRVVTGFQSSSGREAVMSM